jgi:hypothetical protein
LSIAAADALSAASAGLKQIAHEAKARMPRRYSRAVAERDRTRRSVEDPGGHRWELTQTVRDVEPAEWGGEGSW